MGGVIVGRGRREGSRGEGKVGAGGVLGGGSRGRDRVGGVENDQGV